jgi:hypothetical protein
VSYPSHDYRTCGLNFHASQPNDSFSHGKLDSRVKFRQMKLIFMGITDSHRKLEIGRRDRIANILKVFCVL